MAVNPKKTGHVAENPIDLDAIEFTKNRPELYISPEKWKHMGDDQRKRFGQLVTAAYRSAVSSATAEMQDMLMKSKSLWNENTKLKAQLAQQKALEEALARKTAELNLAKVELSSKDQKIASLAEENRKAAEKLAQLIAQNTQLSNDLLNSENLRIGTVADLAKLRVAHEKNLKELESTQAQARILQQNLAQEKSARAILQKQVTDLSKDNAELRTKNDQLTTLVTQLQTELAENIRIIKQHKAALDDEVRKNQALAAENAIYQINLSVLRDDKTKLTAELEKASSALQAANNATVLDADKIKSLSDTNKRLLSELEALKKNEGVLSETIKTQTETINAKDAEIRKLIADLQASQLATEQALREKEQAVKECAVARGEAASLKVQLEAAKTEKDLAIRNAAELEAQLKNATLAREQALDDKVKLQSQVDLLKADLLGRIQELEVDKVRNEALIAELKKQLTDQEARAKELLQINQNIISGLSSRVEGLTADKAQLAAKNMQLTKQVVGLTKELDQKNARILELEKEVATLKLENEKLRAQLVQQQTVIQTQAKNLDDMSRKNVALNADLISARANEASLAEKNTKLQAALLQATNNFDTLKTQADSLQNALNASTGDKTKLQSDLDEATRKLTDARLEREALTRATTEANILYEQEKARADQLEREVTELKTRITAYEQQLKSLSADLEERNRLISEKEQTIQNLDSRNKILTTQLADSERMVSTLQNTLAQKSTVIDTLNSTIQQNKILHENAITALEAQLEKEKTASVEERQKIEARIASMKAAYEATLAKNQEELSSAQAEAKGLRTALSKANEKIVSLNAEINSLKLEIDRLNKLVATLAEELGRKNAEISAKNAVIDKINADNDRLNATLTTVTSHAKKTETALGLKAKEVDDLNNKIKTKDAEFNAQIQQLKDDMKNKSETDKLAQVAAIEDLTKKHELEIRDANAKLDAAQREKDRLSKDLVTANSQIASLSTQVADLTKDLTAKNQALLQQTANLQAAKDNIARLTDEAAKNTQLVAQLKEQTGQQEVVIASQKAAIEQLGKKQDSLNSELDKSEKALLQTQRDLSAKDEVVKNLQNDIETKNALHQQAVSALEARFASEMTKNTEAHKAAVKALEAAHGLEVSAIRAQLELASRQKEELTKQLDLERKKVEGLTAEIADLKSKYAKQSETVVALEADLKKKNTEIAEKTAAISKLTESNLTLNRQLEAAIGENAKANLALQAKAQEAATLEGEIARNKAEFEAAKRALELKGDAAKAELASLQTAFATRDMENTRKLEKAKADQAVIETRLQQETRRANLLTDQVNSQARQISELQSNLNSTINERDRALDKIRTLGEEIKAWQAKYEASEAARMKLERDLEVARTAILEKDRLAAESSQKISSLSTELTGITAQLSSLKGISEQDKAQIAKLTARQAELTGALEAQTKLLQDVQRDKRELQDKLEQQKSDSEFWKKLSKLNESHSKQLSQSLKAQIGASEKIRKRTEITPAFIEYQAKPSSPDLTALREKYHNTFLKGTDAAMKLLKCGDIKGSNQILGILKTQYSNIMKDYERTKLVTLTTKPKVEVAQRQELDQSPQTGISVRM